MVYKLTAARFFRAEHSARPGCAALHAVDFYRRQFRSSNCCELGTTSRNLLEQVGNRVGICVVVTSTKIVVCVVVLGPWMPLFLHSFWYTHGFLHNTGCPNFE